MDQRQIIVGIQKKNKNKIKFEIIFDFSRKIN